MKRLPFGNQDFETVIRENRVYVDKTEILYNLMNGSKYNFLSRPRRFGKSLTVSTLKYIFEGRKDLFQGLWIEKSDWNWEETFPVIYLPMDGILDKKNGLDNSLEYALNKIAWKHNIIFETNSYSGKFDELITKLHEKYNQRVVILIDEYDKPITDNIEKKNWETATNNRDILREFYRCLKSSEPHIRFVFITGISKFAQTSIFSVLNNLNDISLNERYWNILGYTQENLQNEFKEYFEEIWIKKYSKISYQDFMLQVKKWYNGYSWDGIQYIYNPFSILGFLENRIFSNYWFKTATPFFLIDLMKQQKNFIISNLYVNEELIDSYDIENLNVRTLLFQTGYLTIKKRDLYGGAVELAPPNQEVEESMRNYIIHIIYEPSFVNNIAPIFSLQKAFQDNNLEKVISITNSVLAATPNIILDTPKEHWFQIIVHYFFKFFLNEIHSEVLTSDGRIDCVVKTLTHIFVIEFKMDETADDALHQIKSKKYYDPYLNEEKQIILVGINFNSESKKVDGWKYENYSTSI